MTDAEKLQKIEELLKGRTSCLCSMWESCEICSSTSQLNRFRDDIKEIIYGQRPQRALADYGRVVKIDERDLL